MAWQDVPCKFSKYYLNRDGYPIVMRDGKAFRLTRLVLEEKLGRPIKEKYECCHHCDKPACIEPEHLWEGTRGQNVRDAWRKRRGRSGWSVEKK